MTEWRSRTILRYVIAGLLIGGFWYVNRHRSPLEEALRTIAVFALLLVALRARLRRRNIEIQIVPLLAAKAILVAVAALIQSSIVGVVAHAGLMTAVGLGVAVAIIGPLLDHRFFHRSCTVSAN